jgi:hypothetical protein
MRTRRHRQASVLAGAAAAIVLGGSSVLAGDEFGQTTVLRTVPEGRLLRVADIGATGNDLGVVWHEVDEDFGTMPRIRFRVSTDGGETFAGRKLVDTRDSIEAQADICAGFLWISYAMHDPGDDPGEWQAVMSGRPIIGGGGFGSLLSDPGEYNEAHHPDIACVGNRRHIVAWVEEQGAVDELFVDLPAIFPDIKDPPPDYHFGPFAAHTPRQLSVAATKDRAYVAWVRRDAGEERLRFKRYDVGPGPDSTVTAHPTITLPDMPEYIAKPELAAHGDMVLLAYTTEADLFVRRSFDGGMTWTAREKLRDSPYPSEVEASAQSADVRGAKMVINAAHPAGVFEIDSPQFRFRSSTAGADWSMDSLGGDGYRVGQFIRAGGALRLAEAWDRYFAESGRQKLRFHRET